MWFLFFQIWIWLLAAFALGWFSHWFFCCRGKEKSDGKAAGLQQVETASGEENAETDGDGRG